MKHRPERVRELIKRELGDLIVRELTFDQLVTIQSVDVTPDFKHAHIFVGILGGDETAAKAVLAKLHDHRKELQSLLARRVVLKYTPQLHFKQDTAVERGTRVIDILESLNLPPESEDSSAPKDKPSENDGL